MSAAVTHYTRHAPESEQCREHVAREAFTAAQMESDGRVFPILD